MPKAIVPRNSTDRTAQRSKLNRLFVGLGTDQVDTSLVDRAIRIRLRVMREVGLRRGVVGQRPARLRYRPHLHQHPAYVRMVDYRAALAVAARHTLHPFLRKRQRLLVSAF